jgi:hypothetical protein
MRIKALQSFSGTKITMAAGEVKEVRDKSVWQDLIKCGYAVEAGESEQPAAAETADGENEIGENGQNGEGPPEDPADEEDGDDLGGSGESDQENAESENGQKRRGTRQSGEKPQEVATGSRED